MSYTFLISLHAAILYWTKLSYSSRTFYYYFCTVKNQSNTLQFASLTWLLCINSLCVFARICIKLHIERVDEQSSSRSLMTIAQLNVFKLVFIKFIKMRFVLLFYVQDINYFHLSRCDLPIYIYSTDVVYCFMICSRLLRLICGWCQLNWINLIVGYLFLIFFLFFWVELGKFHISWADYLS